MAGIFFIVTGACGFGNYFSTYLRLHLKQLVECREIFARMDAEREYLRLPYAQLLRRTATGRSGVFFDILSEVAEGMEASSEADAEVLWKAAIRKRDKQFLLCQEETEILLSLAKSLMMEGNHTQVAKIYFMQLEDRILQVMKEKKEKQKLCGAISILGGLFLVILLL